LNQIAATKDFAPAFIAAARQMWRNDPENAAYQGLQQFKPPDVVLNNTVVVDGATVAKTIEQRLISQRQLGGS
jgi:alpha-glucuronidase